MDKTAHISVLTLLSLLSSHGSTANPDIPLKRDKTLSKDISKAPSCLINIDVRIENTVIVNQKRGDQLLGLMMWTKIC